jgi:hypothetical protein
MDLPGYNCVLCTNNLEEIVLHLFLRCPFSKQCQDLIGVHVNYALSGFQILESFKMQIAQPLYMKILVVVCWSV